MICLKQQNVAEETLCEFSRDSVLRSCLYLLSVTFFMEGAWVIRETGWRKTLLQPMPRTQAAPEAIGGHLRPSSPRGAADHCGHRSEPSRRSSKECKVQGGITVKIQWR